MCYRQSRRANRPVDAASPQRWWSSTPGLIVRHGLHDKILLFEIVAAYVIPYYFSFVPIYVIVIASRTRSVLPHPSGAANGKRKQSSLGFQGRIPGTPIVSDICAFHHSDAAAAAHVKGTTPPPPQYRYYRGTYTWNIILMPILTEMHYITKQSNLGSNNIIRTRADETLRSNNRKEIEFFFFTDTVGNGY